MKLLLSSSEEVQREQEKCRKVEITHMATPQELWVFDESLLSQLLVEKLVHFQLQTVP